MNTTNPKTRRLPWMAVVATAAISLGTTIALARADQTERAARPASSSDPTSAPAPAAQHATAATPASPAASTSAPVAAASHAPPATLTEAERSLWQTEEAFAASFAARDPERFASFLADDAVFNGRTPLRGKAAVLASWTKMMTTGSAPPFSWRPNRAVVSGELGMTGGPVYEPSGKQVSAFQSVWRRQSDGSWRIVLDSAAACEEPAP